MSAEFYLIAVVVTFGQSRPENRMSMRYNHQSCIPSEQSTIALAQLAMVQLGTRTGMTMVVAAACGSDEIRDQNRCEELAEHDKPSSPVSHLQGLIHIATFS